LNFGGRPLTWKVQAGQNRDKDIMRLAQRSLILAAAFTLLGAVPAFAQSCTQNQVADAVDKSGAALRAINAERGPKLQARMRQLKDKRGWSDAEYEEKAFMALQDKKIAAFDEQSNDLLARIDTLGALVPQSEADCAKIAELTAASLELQATMRAKTAYMTQRLDALLNEGATPAPARAAAEPPRSLEPKAAQPQISAASPAASAPPASAAPKAAPKPGDRPWETSTNVDPQRGAPPAVAGNVPPAVAGNPAEGEGYTIDEIRAVSEGVFGKVTTGLGSIVEHAFRKSGRPTGYVIGSEGGGAIIAGLRYGSGTLYLRSGGTQKIYWHGPTIGYDLGAEGSKVMFLIYKLETPEDLYARFTAIDGSAYVVGGVGITFVTNTRVTMAPIRSGLGLRLGANIGYIRFTPKPTWNPF
jgi:hypothetical protein